MWSAAGCWRSPAPGSRVNLLAASILHRAGAESLNVSAALRHVLADLAGSVGVIVAALVILVTGWEYADPLVSVLIGLLVLGSSWSILRDAGRRSCSRRRRAASTSRRSGPRWPRSRAWSRSTTCTCGRSPPGFRRSPPMSPSAATPTATRSAASSRRCSRGALRPRAHDAPGRPRGRGAASDRDSGKTGREADRVDLDPVARPRSRRRWGSWRGWVARS